MGVDLGQAADYTALTVVERLPNTSPLHLHCRHLERYALGTLYPDVVGKVTSLLAQPLLRGAALVVDATGVGRPVVDMFRQANLRPIAALVTAGDAVTQDSDYWRVPKRDLVGAVQAPLQDGRLKFAAGMALVPTLVQEMINFKVKITASANDTYGAWREGEHDDLIFAVMLAAWWAQRSTGGTVRQSTVRGRGGRPIMRRNVRRATV